MNLNFFVKENIGSNFFYKIDKGLSEKVLERFL
jgi:hypothetical protein